MSDYFDRVERQIMRRVEQGAPRRSRMRLAAGQLAVAAGVLVVILVAGVFLLARGGEDQGQSPAVHPGGEIVFAATPTQAAEPLGRAIDQSIKLLRERLPGTHVARSGDTITVSRSGASPSARRKILALAAPGRLVFYDWEADVVTQSGKTVASLLAAQDPQALAASQGSGAAAPGGPGAGSMSLGQAQALAFKLAPRAPRHIEYIGGLKVAVPAGYIVVRAAAPRPGATSQQFFVLKDHPALSNGAIVNPAQSTDANASQPDIKFDFTAAGGRAFKSLTAAVARRGSRVSVVGETLNQHFAVALDNTLLTVPFIDSKQYPEGISGDRGADISSSFTTESARLIALLLRYGPLPMQLTAAG